ncbi:MAG TPA: ABC transporter ATP-binding protein [Kiloniellales bacterium]
MSLLTTHGLDAFYGDFQAVFGIDFRLDDGETIAIIGANGAGKSTFLRALAGLLPANPEAVRFDGRAIGGLPANKIAKLGIAMVPEGRHLFRSCTVEENLRLGTLSRRRGRWDLARVYDLFPALRARRRSPSTALSGGEQQMAAIGRALMANPRIILFDEISLGLAPAIIKDLYRALPAITGEGTAAVVVEQDINQALAVSTRVYCFQEGRVSLEGRPRDLGREQITAAYFGV